MPKRVMCPIHVILPPKQEPLYLAMAFSRVNVLLDIMDWIVRLRLRRAAMFRAVFLRLITIRAKIVARLEKEILAFVCVPKVDGEPKANRWDHARVPAITLDQRVIIRATAPAVPMALLKTMDRACVMQGLQDPIAARDGSIVPMQAIQRTPTECWVVCATPKITTVPNANIRVPIHATV